MGRRKVGSSRDENKRKPNTAIMHTSGKGSKRGSVDSFPYQVQHRKCETPTYLKRTKERGNNIDQTKQL